MKIAIVIKRDLEGCIALNHILKTIPGHAYTVILSDKFTETERNVEVSARFIFYERDLPVRQIFPLIEKADRGSGSPELLTFDQIRERHGIEVVIADDINSGYWEKRLENLGPDIILSVRNDFIFKKHIIDIPRHGIYNVHPGALPEYRGVYAPFRAMLNNEETAGCTLHRVDTGIDTGPVVGINRMAVDYSRSVLWHMCKLYPLGIDLFRDLLINLEKGEPAPLHAQDESRKGYYSFPSAEEFQTFSDRGHKLIDNDEYLDLLSGFGN